MANLCEDPVGCDVSFKPLGCFKDQQHQRALPYHIYNERDDSIDNYGGQMINWHDWENYLPAFICRCANRAKEHGYDLIGVQFFGKPNQPIFSSHIMIFCNCVFCEADSTTSTLIFLSRISVNLLAFYHECRSLIGYATYYLFCDSE